MKVAVCLSGLPVSGKAGGRDITLNFKRLLSKFPKADFFLGTWESHHAFVKNLYSTYDVVSIKEPEMLYHPYEDAPEEYLKIEKFAKMVKQCKTDKKSKDKFLHQNKQIIAHSIMNDKLSEDYDVVVRVRYDTFVSAKADFDIYVQKCYENKKTYGFAWMQNVSDFHSVSEIEKDSQYRNCFLFDQLIIHRRDMLNKEHVMELFDNKKLLPAEFGWWQVLSEPYGNNHVCMLGWANPDKSIDERYFK